ncbi:putative RNase H-like HicB family nuclease [Erwinia toletana]|uniref:RNase H-like HicB family nuclease n=1 Tax=Winslowiella toletana TaxID=92490 RepID=A0ABS4P2F1_9GAMM|nr:type II toxin-antitoxin system HicB family antitoxin [Winslowiella toletana]MBP2166835.1 putative RNase H-like HicB family nuclease [Winslowiella toletana]
MLYSAYIHVDADGSASGYFPDVTGCYFAGNSPAETRSDARSALQAHFELMAEKGLTIPESSGEWNLNISADNGSKEDDKKGIWIYVDIDITKYLGKSERINITMPHLLIEKIDKAVGKTARYSSRSHFLAEAARKELYSL